MYVTSSSLHVLFFLLMFGLVFSSLIVVHIISTVRSHEVVTLGSQTGSDIHLDGCIFLNELDLAWLYE